MPLLSDYSSDALDLVFSQWGLEDPEDVSVNVEGYAAAIGLVWPRAFYLSLEAASGRREPGGIQELVTEIVTRHHRYARNALGDIHSQLDSLAGDATWATVSEAFGEMESVLLDHFSNEERETFPWLEDLDGGEDRFGSLDALEDHLETLNADHAVPRMVLPAICDASQALETAGQNHGLTTKFKELGADLARHTALEEDALFPLARVILVSRTAVG